MQRIETNTNSSSFDDPILESIELDSGEPVDVAKLFEQMRPQLMRLAKDAVERRWQSKLSASDIVQDTLHEAAVSGQKFQGGTVAEFEQWVRMILKNNAQDARRKFVDAEKRTVNREQTLEADSRVLGKPNAKTPSSIARGREFDAGLHAAIGELSEVDQQILNLRFRHQWTFDQIGQSLQMNSDTVRQRLPGLLKRLEVRLQEFDSKER